MESPKFSRLGLSFLHIIIYFFGAAAMTISVF